MCKLVCMCTCVYTCKLVCMCIRVYIHVNLCVRVYMCVNLIATCELSCSFYFSFGQSAVFLVGGRSKAVQPSALLLRSGDVVIMSGSSRLAYHGVPRIISPPVGETVPHCLTQHTLEQCIEEAGTLEQQRRQGHFVCTVCGSNRAKKARTMRGKDFSPNCFEGEVIETHRRKSREEDEADPCMQCAELLHSWPDFEHYLSMSRINVNVRQVGILCE